MCGIWAIFGSNECVSDHCSSCMKIAHRGPDCFRFENIPQYDNCALGFHRLTIVDGLHGMQPQRLHSLPHLWLCCNGEIYNCKLVQKEFEFSYETSMDGEAAIHLYNKGGIEFMAQHLDGVFGMCLLDTENKLVHLVRDTFGVRPVFRMLTDDGTLAVSSEAKGLVDIELGNGKKRNIEPFPPGHYETYELLPSGKVRFMERNQFHSIGQLPRYKTLVATADADDMFGNIRSLLKAAVRKRFMSERRIGCLLSGGLDSSLVAALMMEVAKEEGVTYPIQTFSTGIEDCPDIVAARKVAAHIGSEHHEVLFNPSEGLKAHKRVSYYLETYDIVCNRAGVAMYLLAKYISEQTDSIVIFSGEGADEVTQGYTCFQNPASPEAAHAESLRLCQDLHLFQVLRADRAMAAHGLEMRLPYLDHQFTGYYLSLPQSARSPRQGVEKYLLRQAFDGTGLLPSEVLWRPKEVFFESLSSEKKKGWTQTLNEHIDGQISDEDLSEAGELFPFNTPTTKEAYFYRKVFESHFPGQSRWTPYFWMSKWWAPGVGNMAHPYGKISSN